jgi:hypothetical protein
VSIGRGIDGLGGGGSPIWSGSSSPYQDDNQWKRGGSGVVVISAPVSAVSSTVGASCVGGRKVYVFTGSGSIRF